MSETLYDQLGGAAAVDAAVDIFYRKVLGDRRVSRFFGGTDMAAQRAKQKAFLTMVFGGPDRYDGRDLRTAHASLVARGLDDSHFDVVAGHLQATLDEQRVPTDLARQVMAVAASTRSYVLGRR